MAIFSSSKKKKADANGTSPPLGQGGSNAAFPRSQSGSFGQSAGFGAQQGMSQHQSNPSLGSNKGDESMASQQSASSGPMGPGSPSQGGTQHAVLYPWSLRRLHLLPSSLLAPVDPAYPGAIAQSIPGAVSPAPFPRYGHSVNPVASAATGDLYVFGGLVQNAVKNDLYVLSCVPAPEGKASGALSVGLVETRGEVPGPRVGHASVGVGNVLIVWGGDTKAHPDDRQDDGLYLLNLSTKEWTRVKTQGPAPEGRYGHAAAMVGSKFFIFGGQKDDGGFMNDLVWFDLQKLKAGSPKWTFVDYAPGAVVPPKRTGHTTVTHGDCIYIFGGTDGQFHYNDTWSYDTNAGTWTELSCIGYIPVPREGHAATLVDDVMYVFGGRGVDGKDLEDLAAFKISTQRWFMFQNMGPAPSGRSGHAMATWQNKVYVLGGESYTSARADDPSMLHVLDTSKIKYPPDSAASNRPAASSNVARKSSIPTMIGSPPATGPPAMNPPMSPTLNSSVGSSNDGESKIPRSKALNGSTAAQPSLGQIAEQAAPIGAVAAVAAGGKIPKRQGTGPTPARPARPDDGSDSLTGSPADRARSPTSANGPQTRNVISPTGSQGSARQRPSPPQVGAGQFEASQPRQRQLSAEDETAGSNNGHGDAFYSVRANGRSSPSPDSLAAKDAEIATLQARETWMKTALAIATRRGFVPSEALQGLDAQSIEQMQPALEEGHQRQIVAAVLALKAELANAKAAMSDQAQQTNDRIAGATKAKAAALQEAAYYRAKLAALESGNVGDATKLDRERANELERKLAEMVSAKVVLERQVSKLEQERDAHAERAAQAEERHSAAASRADAAEGSYSRSLAEYAELQRRAHAHEATIQEHIERIAGLDSSSRQLQADHSALSEKHAAADANISKHVQALGETQAALEAASARNEHLHGAWQTAQRGLDEHQSRASQLEADLQAKSAQHEAALAKADELEKTVEQHRVAEAASAAMATGGLAALLAHHEASKNREVESSPEEGQAQAAKIEALEGELAQLRELQAQSVAQREAATGELAEVRAREIALQTQLGQLRAELSALRGQHAQAVDEVARHQLAAVDHEATSREAHSKAEAAEVKAGLLRNIMQDHGLSVTDEELQQRYPPLDGTETAESLHRRVQDLQGRLDSRTRDHTQLETAHDDVRRELAEATQRHAEQVQGLTTELEGARAAGGGSNEELAALQTRHKTLEATHLKAVQYVKGTEKMLRRMKEELTRYKERCEELEAKSGEVPPAAKAEIEQLKAQIAGLEASHSSEREALQGRLVSVQGEHERALNEHRANSGRDLAEAKEELQRLDEALASAHHDLEETLAVNASLNASLTSALKDPNSSRGTGGNAGLEQELTQAQNKTEWLKRENAALEERARAAEDKIAILLDHLEGATGTTEGEGFDSQKFEGGEEWEGASAEGSEYSFEGQHHRA